jgi:hypothetical protein
MPIWLEAWNRRPPTILHHLRHRTCCLLDDSRQHPVLRTGSHDATEPAAADNCRRSTRPRFTDLMYNPQCRTCNPREDSKKHPVLPRTWKQNDRALEVVVVVVFGRDRGWARVPNDGTSRSDAPSTTMAVPTSRSVVSLVATRKLFARSDEQKHWQLLSERVSTHSPWLPIFELRSLRGFFNAECALALRCASIH